MTKIQVSVSDIVSKMNIIFVTVVLFIGLCASAPVDNSPRLRDNYQDSSESSIETATDTSTQLPGLEEFFKYTWFLYHFKGENNTVESTRYSVYETTKLSKHSSFDPKKKTVVFVHGFHNNQNSHLVQEMCEAFVLHNGDYNMVTLDWDYFALLDYYEVASPIAKKYGEWVGGVILDQGLNPSNIYLIGASLGCHVCGGIGKGIYDRSGTKVSRISALDPAGPNFEGQTPNAETCMKADDAEMVDVIHGDAGYYGFNRATGTSDFWPNEGIRDQPGCPKSNSGAVTQNESNKCSHERPVRYFIESVRNPSKKPGFIGMKKHDDGTMSREETAPMGLHCPPTARGNYFLRTNTVEPFALGINGIDQ